jgi:hypothetical protein
LLAFITKYQVNPFIYVFGYVLRFESLAKAEDDLLGTAGPLWALYIVYFCFILLESKVYLISVAQELRPRIKLRN